MIEFSSPKDRNVLWLNNHITACNFECELLRSLGYNVFVPKYFPSHNRSFSVTYEFDKDLPISAAELEILNQHDFYSSHWPEGVLAVLNRHFGTAIVACFADMVYEAVAGFKGRILLRSYGPFNEKATVWRFLEESLAPGIRRQLAEIGDRFWFSEAYPNLADPEHEFLKSRRVNHPTGIATSIQARRDTYKRAIEKVLIVLPDIAGGDHQSAEAYPQVRQHFARIPKVIAGKQSVKVDDPDVPGMIPTPEYERLLGGAAAMFYHNINPRHVHYHPVEAACFGMPVIFMGRGMLGVLGSSDAPGACKTYEEAALKLERILKGDEALISDVIAAQKPWVDYFMSEWNREAWTERFSRQLIERSPLPPKKPRKRLALIFGLHPGPFFPELAGLFARSFRDASAAEGEDVEIVLALTKGDFNESDLLALEDRKLQGRLFEWQSRSIAEIAASLEFSGRRARLWSDHYLVPHDLQGSLQDCDAWILITGSQGLEHPVAPLKPIIPILEADAAGPPRRVLQELMSNAKAIAVPGNLRKSSLTRIGPGPLETFQAPRFQPSSEAGPPNTTQGGGILLVLPRVASPEAIGDLRLILDSGAAIDGTIRHFKIILTSGLAEQRQGSAADLSRFEEVETAIQELLGENRYGRELSGTNWPRIDAPRGNAKIRAAFRDCAGIWFPLGPVFDIGLLAAAAARRVPVVSFPSSRLSTMAEMIGLDYRPAERQDLHTISELLSAPKGAVETARIDLAEIVDPESFSLTWADVVKSL